MKQPDWPSGNWIGFYVYSRSVNNRHRMDLALTFSKGRVTGSGSDDIGKFVIKGGYSIRDGSCYWSKQYLGAHDVCYTGYREGRGIWGTWVIDYISSGGFQIWPLGEGVAAKKQEEETRSAPVVIEGVVPSIAFPGDNHRLDPTISPK